MLKISLTIFEKYFVRDTTAYTILALHFVLFVIIIKVQVSCKYQHFIWAKAVNKKSVIYYKPNVLGLNPNFP